MSFPDVIPIIDRWLDANSSKIEGFWIGAEWRYWARFELFTILDKAFGKECLVYHSIEIWDKNKQEQADVYIEPRDAAQGPIAIRLRCENVNENAGSFEDFSQEYQNDWKLVKELDKNVDGSYESVRVILLGFSGEKSEVGGPAFGELEPEHIHSGNVWGWYLHDDTTVQ